MSIYRLVYSDGTWELTRAETARQAVAERHREEPPITILNVTAIESYVASAPEESE